MGRIFMLNSFSAISKIELRRLSNKTGTSKVGAISKAQKAQNIFFGKKLEIFEIFFLSKNVAQCRKKSKGGPFSLGRFCSLRLKSKKRKGGPFGDKKKFRKKSRTVPKKKSKGGTL